MTRAAEIAAEKRDRLYRRVDRMFLLLLASEWVFAIVLALLISPWSYDGATRSLHMHVKAAFLFGGLINALPITLILTRPGWSGTRQSIAVVQMLWSAILIMITGGRVETHFHVFGSLAFLALYRDWRVLPTATAVVVVDHLARGMWWPDSVYGVNNPEWWRFLEHAGWVVFEDVVLFWGCALGVRDIETEATLEHTVLDIKRQQQLQSELAQAQKLESLGRLAAGVAHEINTPIQFVGDSVEFVQTAIADVMEIVEKQQAVVQSVLDGRPSMDLAHDAEQRIEQADLPYLSTQLPAALERVVGGVERVATIVRSMKVLAHPHRAEMVEVDLNSAIENTLTVARHEYHYVADIETDYGELPPVSCNESEINQVVLNIIVNAAHAIDDLVKNTPKRGKIRIKTRHEAENVAITIADTGGGIPDQAQAHIFDPFFTTKEVGRGTGQGLAIARTVIVENHGGTLTFDSSTGLGTTFVVTIPVRSQVSATIGTSA